MVIGVAWSMLALPVAWPASGQGPSGLSAFGTALEREQLEMAADESGIPTPSVLPATGSGQVWSGLGAGGQLNQQEILASQLAISGFSFEASAPSVLPVTGSSRAILSGLGAASQRDQLEILAYQLAASGVQFEAGSPGILPVTGGQSNPYLELLEQYRPMHGRS